MTRRGGGGDERHKGSGGGLKEGILRGELKEVKEN